MSGRNREVTHCLEGERGCRVSIRNLKVWKEVNEIGTEMVISERGRKMFPPLFTTVKGLAPERFYTIKLCFRQVDSKIYMFSDKKQEWKVVKAEGGELHSASWIHRDSPKLGSQWMERPLFFKDLRLINSKSALADQVTLRSGRKYRCEVVIVEKEAQSTEVFPLPETEFICVTAYRSEKFVHFKKNHKRSHQETFADNSTPLVATGPSTHAPSDSPVEKSPLHSNSDHFNGRMHENFLPIPHLTLCDITFGEWEVTVHHRNTPPIENRDSPSTLPCQQSPVINPPLIAVGFAWPASNNLKDLKL